MIVMYFVNRLVGRCAGYLLDFHVVYVAVVEIGIAFEIDGVLSYFDLDGEYVR